MDALAKEKWIFLAQYLHVQVRHSADHQFGDCSWTKVQQLSGLRKQTPSHMTDFILYTHHVCTSPGNNALFFYISFAITRQHVLINLLGFSLTPVHRTQCQSVFQMFYHLKVHPSCFQFVLRHQIEKSRVQMTLLPGYKIIMQYQNKFVCGT